MDVGLSEEQFDQLGISSQFRQELLEHDLLLEATDALLDPSIDPTHATASNGILDHVSIHRFVGSYHVRHQSLDPRCPRQYCAWAISSASSSSAASRLAARCAAHFALCFSMTSSSFRASYRP